ncbi:hypothetical protein KQQSB11_170043 [Klebsiella quasipneumoniae subsp. quasipneumoniae]|nr:hypothetical protein KQQSB11_170043 [Klebsiella quasipneumoniae subsp. quasipneumoniae]
MRFAAYLRFFSALPYPIRNSGFI